MPSETTYRGYVIKNRKGLKHWEPLLEEWLLCIERYCRIWKGGDAPYIHKERANIGLLSAAAGSAVFSGFWSSDSCVMAFLVVDG